MKESIKEYLLNLGWSYDNAIFKKTIADQSRSFIINGVPQQQSYEACIEFFGETTDDNDDVLCMTTYKINNDIIGVMNKEDFDYFYKLIFNAQ